MNKNPQALAGLRILLTRPQGQAGLWREGLEQAGATVRHVPALDIVPAEPGADQLQQMRQVLSATASSKGAGIFVSQNAVLQLRRWLELCGWQLQCGQWRTSDGQIPDLQGIEWLAVGPNTAALAELNGFTPCNGNACDSESLLQQAYLAQVSIKGRTVCLFKGAGGRRMIAENLRSRAAIVEELSLYQRSVPDKAAELRDALCNWQPQVVSANSGDSVRNIVTMLNDKHEAQGDVLDQLRACTLLVPGQRVAHFAQSQGFNNVLQSRSIELADVLYCLSQWWQQRPPAT